MKSRMVGPVTLRVLPDTVVFDEDVRFITVKALLAWRRQSCFVFDN